MTLSADTIDVRFEFRTLPPEMMATAETSVPEVARSFGALSVSLLRSVETCTFKCAFQTPEEAAGFVAFWKNVIGENCKVTLQTKGWMTESFRVFLTGFVLSLRGSG